MKVNPISTADFQSQGAAQGNPAFTNEQKRNELAREINQRSTVYPGLVRSGRLTQEKADQQTAVMRAIWQEYCEKCENEKAQRQPGLALDDSNKTDGKEGGESVRRPESKQLGDPTLIGVDPAEGETKPQTPAEQPPEKKDNKSDRR